MENLDKLVNRIVSYLDRADSFLSEQMPDFCKQLIDYSAWEAQYNYDIAFWFCLGFGVISIVLIIRGIFSDDSDLTGGCFVLSAITGVVFIVSFLITIGNYKDLKMYKIAPKVYLIKTVKSITAK